MKEPGRLSWICQQFLMKKIITVECSLHKNEQCQLMFVLGLVTTYQGSIKRVLCKLGALQISKKYDLLYWNSLVIGRIIALQRCPCPNPRSCEYVTSYGKMELRLPISRLWDGVIIWDHPGGCSLIVSP